MIPLVHKYRPKSVSDLVGDGEKFSQLAQRIKNWRRGSKAILIYGPSGCGKTSCVFAIASDLGCEIFETNASDFRNTDQINERVGNAIKQQSLFARGKLIFIDEIDGLAGNDDRGGILAIVKLIENSTYPIILAAINPFDNKFSSLRSKSILLEFEHLDYLSIYGLLIKICLRENIQFDESLLRDISRRSGGDARAAINNLQALIDDKSCLIRDGIELLERNKTETIITALNKIFKSTDLSIAISAFDNVSEDLDHQLLWIDENLPKEYTKAKDLAMAYYMLSKADVFSRRIKRWQHYRFLIYINALITAGIAASKDEKYKNFVEYKPTGRLLKIWWANQKSMKKKAIAEKIASKTHSSKKEILKNMMPYLPVMFRNQKMRGSISRELNLDEEEIKWLEKMNKI